MTGNCSREAAPVIAVNPPKQSLPIALSADLHKLQCIAELPQQFQADRGMLRAAELRIGVQQPRRIFARQVQHLQFPGDVGQLELRQTMLANAKELPRAP